MSAGTCASCAQYKRLRSRKSGICSACYAKTTFAKSPEAYARHKAAVTKYQKENPGKRRQWVRTYRLNTGQQIPDDLHALRRALKRLETAVAAAGQRERICGAG
jgi:hypothetical protein